MPRFLHLPPLPFVAGEHKRIVVKIVDDCYIESLKVIGLQ